MKKILITATMFILASASNANAEDKLKLYDGGASINFGNLFTDGSDRDEFGILVGNTGANKRSALNENRSIDGKPMGIETELGLSYVYPVSEKLDSNIKISYRNDANNMLGESDGAAMLRFNYRLN